MTKYNKKPKKGWVTKKPAKTRELTKRQTRQAKKTQKKANPMQDWKPTKDWLTPGYGKKPSISPWEGHQKKTAKKTRTQLYSHKILLLSPAITCELTNLRSILRRRFNPRQVSFFMFKANGQAPVRVVQCLPIYKPNRVRLSYPHLG